jgi:hypothetical protein
VCGPAFERSISWLAANYKDGETITVLDKHISSQHAHLVWNKSGPLINDVHFPDKVSHNAMLMCWSNHLFW